MKLPKLHSLKLLTTPRLQIHFLLVTSTHTILITMLLQNKSKDFVRASIRQVCKIKVIYIANSFKYWTISKIFQCDNININLTIDFTGFDQHEDLLLIVTFYRKEYDSIPLLEILYRPHFKVCNIISYHILKLI